MLRIFKAQPIAYHRYGECVIVQQLLGMCEQTVGDDVLGCAPRLCLHQCAEIAGGETTLVSKPCYRGKTLAMGSGGDIIVEQLYEFPYHRMVDLLAGDELAVVEAETIVQLQFDVGDYELAGMFVDGPVQFLLHHRENTTEHFHFLGGEMEGLGAGVAEELVAAHLLSQRGAVEKVGMEHQGCELGKRHIGVWFNINNLPRGKAGHSHLVEVVGCAAVRELAALVLLEIDGVNTIMHHTLPDVLRILHMHHAHQGMKRLPPLVVVEILYGIDKNLFHII